MRKKQNKNILPPAPKEPAKKSGSRVYYNEIVKQRKFVENGKSKENRLYDIVNNQISKDFGGCEKVRLYATPFFKYPGWFEVLNSIMAESLGF